MRAIMKIRTKINKIDKKIIKKKSVNFFYKGTNGKYLKFCGP